MGFKNQGHKVGWIGNVQWIWEDLWEGSGYDPNTLYELIKVRRGCLLKLLTCTENF